MTCFYCHRPVDAPDAPEEEGAVFGAYITVDGRLWAVCAGCEDNRWTPDEILTVAHQSGLV